MKSDIIFYIQLAVSFLPFVLFAFLNGKANVSRENRNRQYVMPLVAILYGVVLLLFLSKLSAFFTAKVLQLADFLEKADILSVVATFIREAYTKWGAYIEAIVFNTITLLVYITVKRIFTIAFSKIKIVPDTFVGSISELFYTYDEEDGRWYIKEHFGQARTFIKTAYYAGCILSASALFASCKLYMQELICAPFYPVFAVIVMGELAYFIDGLHRDEHKADFSVQTDKSSRIAMYPLLRKPLRTLFGDKLSAEGTTLNNGSISGGANEEILAVLEHDGGHIGANYAAFIRRKMESGLKPNEDYVRCGYDLAIGKSLLFNTPFYDKLNPYVCYAMNRALLTGGKVLVVLGRHGVEDDLRQWCENGMRSVSNVPELWKIDVLSGKKVQEDELPDVGIISRSGVHDLDIHKSNHAFLRKVTFVVLVEPSRLVTTAQIGLNLLIKCCGNESPITFCSVDRNCDGLVDALSHILMTDISEVSATEYPRGASSYMCWTVDNDYMQHRILPGVSRYLGMGTELSMVALRNQVRNTVWYGGDVYPVVDAHWIAKQYYYDLLEYAQLPTNQETFDRSFKTSFNLCNERVSDYSYITVEDDRNNLFETRRNFATIADQQGFVNVISSEYLLREYMSSNPELFTADAKAIPYITADYARTARNNILSLCLLLCIDAVPEETLKRQASMLNLDMQDPATAVWSEICVIFGESSDCDKNGTPILSVTSRIGKNLSFEKDKTLLLRREYCVESGKFKSVYTIEDAEFSAIILDDLQNAKYIAEEESKDSYIGTELKGHIYQKYMPGQFFTLNGKYYEMASATTADCILVRRASEHIDGRLAYRQVRNYTIHHLEDSDSMGALKTVNNVDIHYQFADFSVETPGYWKLRAYNDFDNGDLVTVNGIPVRNYHHKQILKFDFSKFGDSFTDSVRMTLTNLINEVFVTLFAENQPFIAAVTPGQYEAPLTYSLAVEENEASSDKCIYIIEDSQLDIGLLIAVERNVKRIFQIISDYLAWNDEQIAKSICRETEPVEEEKFAVFNVYEESTPAEKKKNFFGKIGGWFKGLFKKKKKASEANSSDDGLTPRQRRRAEKAKAKAEKKAARERKKAERQGEQQKEDRNEEIAVEVETIVEEAEQTDTEESINETVVEVTGSYEETSAEEETNEEGEVGEDE